MEQPIIHVSQVNEFYMADPNSITGLKFHKNFSPGGLYFCGILVPWTKFFRTEISQIGHVKQYVISALFITKLGQRRYEIINIPHDFCAYHVPMRVNVGVSPYSCCVEARTIHYLSDRLKTRVLPYYKAKN